MSGNFTNCEETTLIQMFSECGKFKSSIWVKKKEKKTKHFWSFHMNKKLTRNSSFASGEGFRQINAPVPNSLKLF